MQVRSIKGHFLSEIEQELSTILINDFKPDLALVFCSVSQNINEIRNLFTKHTIDLIGATTAGEIFDQVVLEKSIVVLLLQLDRSVYDIQLYENNDGDLFKLGEKATKDAVGQFSNPSVIVLSGGLRANGEELVNGLKKHAPDASKIFGALAGDDLQMKNTYVFTNQQVSNNAIVRLALDNSKIQAEGVAISGWESIGTEKVITSSKGNVVFSIDYQPALDIFMDYFNKPKERLAESDLVVNELAQYPLQVIRDEDYSVLRAPLMADVAKGALVFSGTVQEGSRIKFSVPPGFETIDTTTQEIAKVKNIVPKADVVLMFSCKARHQALGPLVEEEIEGIQNLWKVPLIGFFSYGEIGNVEGHSCDFHNETVSLVVLKEL